MNHQDKILLILDLDETLIHATTTQLSSAPNFQVFKYLVYKRPFLEDFLTTCNQFFDLAVWSSASDDYVKEIVENIFPENLPLKFVWGRSRCTPKSQNQINEFGYYDGFDHYHYNKHLIKVKKQGYDLRRVLIVEDTPSKVANSYGNAIYIKEYKGEKEDNYLLLLSKYLLTLKDVENVRTLEKRGWEKRI